MKQLWVLMVAVGLLITGSLSLLPQHDSMALDVPGRATPLTRNGQLALSLAGLPNMVPAPAAASSHGIQVLPDAEQLAETQKELSNLHFISRAGDLLQAETDAYSRKGEHVRMRAVAFLANGAHWLNNPEREAVFATIDESIQKANATIPNDSRQRKSIAGDKVELFEILLREAPERAQDLESRSEGTWLQPILHHAHDRFDRYTHTTAAR